MPLSRAAVTRLLALSLTLLGTHVAAQQAAPPPPPPLPPAAQPAPPPAPPPAPAPAPQPVTQTVVSTASNVPPAVIPQADTSADATGSIETVEPAAVATTGNPFFTALGTNGRTCFSCHQPQSGWTVVPADLAKRFSDTSGLDPVFAAIDGMNCPTADTSTVAARQSASSLLLTKGLIRIALTPPSSQFTLAIASDPYQCSTSSQISVYRRPLPATNLKFLTSIMWDGREASLTSQAQDAITGHEQATQIPSAAVLQQAVLFETGQFTAQASDLTAGSLSILGATGGPLSLAAQSFLPGANDPLAAGFNSNVFTLFSAWSTPLTADAAGAQRQSIARGEQIFNTRPIAITNVAGLNNVTGQATIQGTCSTCHNAPNVGNHTTAVFLNIGTAGTNPPGLDVAALPVFTFACKNGPQAPISLTDPGRAGTTGNCADLGAFKVPVLRGLAARAPYFHNGGAASLADVIGFYDRRFNLGLTPQERGDLAAFLSTL